MSWFLTTSPSSSVLYTNKLFSKLVGSKNHQVGLLGRIPSAPDGVAGLGQGSGMMPALLVRGPTLSSTELREPGHHGFPGPSGWGGDFPWSKVGAGHLHFFFLM